VADTFIGLVNREGVPDWQTNSTGSITEGTSTNASAIIELRLRQGASITKWDAIKALEIFKRWLIEGGQTTGADSNLPII
jgi:hypothetical protein